LILIREKEEQAIEGVKIEAVGIDSKGRRQHGIESDQYGVSDIDEDVQLTT
jgi:hypothetical protein